MTSTKEKYDILKKRIFSYKFVGLNDGQYLRIKNEELLKLFGDDPNKFSDDPNKFSDQYNIFVKLYFIFYIIMDEIISLGDDELIKFVLNESMSYLKKKVPKEFNVDIKSAYNAIADENDIKKTFNSFTNLQLVGDKNFIEYANELKGIIELFYLYLKELISNLNNDSYKKNAFDAYIKELEKFSVSENVPLDDNADIWNSSFWAELKFPDKTKNIQTVMQTYLDSINLYKKLNKSLEQVGKYLNVDVGFKFTWDEKYKNINDFKDVKVVGPLVEIDDKKNDLLTLMQTLIGFVKRGQATNLKQIVQKRETGSLDEKDKRTLRSYYNQYKAYFSLDYLFYLRVIQFMVNKTYHDIYKLTGLELNGWFSFNFDRTNKLNAKFNEKLGLYMDLDDFINTYKLPNSPENRLNNILLLEKKIRFYYYADYLEKYYDVFELTNDEKKKIIASDLNSLFDIMKESGKFTTQSNQEVFLDFIIYKNFDKFDKEKRKRVIDDIVVAPEALQSDSIIFVSHKRIKLTLEEESEFINVKQEKQTIPLQNLNIKNILSILGIELRSTGIQFDPTMTSLFKNFIRRLEEYSVQQEKYVNVDDVNALIFSFTRIVTLIVEYYKKNRTHQENLIKAYNRILDDWIAISDRYLEQNENKNRKNDIIKKRLSIDPIEKAFKPYSVDGSISITDTKSVETASNLINDLKILSIGIQETIDTTIEEYQSDYNEKLEGVLEGLNDIKFTEKKPTIPVYLYQVNGEIVSTNVAGMIEGIKKISEYRDRIKKFKNSQKYLKFDIFDVPDEDKENIIINIVPPKKPVLKLNIFDVDEYPDEYILKLEIPELVELDEEEEFTVSGDEEEDEDLFDDVFEMQEFEVPQNNSLIEVKKEEVEIEEVEMGEEVQVPGSSKTPPIVSVKSEEIEQEDELVALIKEEKVEEKLEEIAEKNEVKNEIVINNAKVEDVKEDIEDVIKKMRDAENKRDSLGVQLTKLKLEYDKNQDRLTSKENEVHKLEEFVKKLIKENETNQMDMNVKINLSQKIISDKEVELKVLQKKLDEANENEAKKISNQIKKITDELNKKSSDLEKQLDDKDKESNEFKSQLENLKADLLKKEDAEKNLENETKKTTQELIKKTAEIDAKTDEIKKLQNELAGERKEVETLKNDLSNLKNLNEDILEKSDVDKKNVDKINELNEEIQKLNRSSDETINTFKNKNAEIKKENEKLLKQIKDDEENRKIKDNIQKELDKKNEEIKKINDEKIKNENENASLRKELDDIKKKIEKTQEPKPKPEEPRPEEPKYRNFINISNEKDFSFGGVNEINLSSIMENASTDIFKNYTGFSKTTKNIGFNPAFSLDIAIDPFNYLEHGFSDKKFERWYSSVLLELLIARLLTNSEGSAILSMQKIIFMNAFYDPYVFSEHIKNLQSTASLKKFPNNNLKKTMLVNDLINKKIGVNILPTVLDENSLKDINIKPYTELHDIIFNDGDMESKFFDENNTITNIVNHVFNNETDGFKMKDIVKNISQTILLLYKDGNNDSLNTQSMNALVQENVIDTISLFPGNTDSGKSKTHREMWGENKFAMHKTLSDIILKYYYVLGDDLSKTNEFDMSPDFTPFFLHYENIKKKTATNTYVTHKNKWLEWNSFFNCFLNTLMVKNDNFVVDLTSDEAMNVLITDEDTRNFLVLIRICLSFASFNEIREMSLIYKYYMGDDKQPEKRRRKDKQPEKLKRILTYYIITRRMLSMSNNILMNSKNVYRESVYTTLTKLFELFSTPVVTDKSKIATYLNFEFMPFYAHQEYTKTFMDYVLNYNINNELNEKLVIPVEKSILIDDDDDEVKDCLHPLRSGVEIEPLAVLSLLEYEVKNTAVKSNQLTRSTGRKFKWDFEKIQIFNITQYKNLTSGFFEKNKIQTALSAISDNMGLLSIFIKVSNVLLKSTLKDFFSDISTADYEVAVRDLTTTHLLSGTDERLKPKYGKTGELKSGDEESIQLFDLIKDIDIIKRGVNNISSSLNITVSSRYPSSESTLLRNQITKEYTDMIDTKTNNSSFKNAYETSLNNAIQGVDSVIGEMVIQKSLLLYSEIVVLVETIQNLIFSMEKIYFDIIVDVLRKSVNIQIENKISNQIKTIRESLIGLRRNTINLKVLPYKTDKNTIQFKYNSFLSGVNSGEIRLILPRIFNDKDKYDQYAEVEKNRIYLLSNDNPILKNFNDVYPEIKLKK